MARSRKGKINLDMTWNDYINKYNYDTLYFVNKDKSSILVIAEGTGDNLEPEDEEEGYVDYWNIETYDKDGSGDGGFLMCKELIRETNPTLQQIIDDVKEYDEVYFTYGDCLINPEEGEELHDYFMELDMELVKKKIEEFKKTSK